MAWPSCPPQAAGSALPDPVHLRAAARSAAAWSVRWRSPPDRARSGWRQRRRSTWQSSCFSSPLAAMRAGPTRRPVPPGRCPCGRAVPTAAHVAPRTLMALADSPNDADWAHGSCGVKLDRAQAVMARRRIDGPPCPTIRPVQWPASDRGRRQMLSRAKRIAVWGLFSLAMLVGSGMLLADRLMPPATGLPGFALPVKPGETELDRELEPLLARRPGQTGAILLPDGLDAFASRALPARKAGRSLDLQYYIWHDDLTGHLLMHEAWEAAERGVRVRIRLDDVHTSGKAAALLARDAHPTLELRVYNPFRSREGLGRLVEMVQRMFSITYRMHNKAWIADNRVAIVGGRNVGTEYFDAHGETNFRDLDVLLFGPEVEQASAIFDTFWNSDAVVPIDRLNSKPRQKLDTVLKAIEEEARGNLARRYLDRVDLSPNLRAYLAQELEPHWTDRIRVLSDPPLKWKETQPGTY